VVELADVDEVEPEALGAQLEAAAAGPGLEVFTVGSWPLLWGFQKSTIVLLYPLRMEANTMISNLVWWVLSQVLKASQKL